MKQLVYMKHVLWEEAIGAKRANFYNVRTDKFNIEVASLLRMLLISTFLLLQSKTKECATKSGDGKPPPPPPKSAREQEQVSLRESLYKATSKNKKRSMENTPKQAASPAEASVPVTILKRESAPKLDNNNEIDARKVVHILIPFRSIVNIEFKTAGNISVCLSFYLSICPLSIC